MVAEPCSNITERESVADRDDMRLGRFLKTSTSCAYCLGKQGIGHKSELPHPLANWVGSKWAMSFRQHRRGGLSHVEISYHLEMI